MKKARRVGVFLAFLICPSLLGAQWARTYGGKGNETAVCVQQTPEGGFIIAGEIADWDWSESSILAVKLSSSGTIIWQKALDMLPNTESGGSFVQTTRDNGFILTGWGYYGGPRMNLLAWKLGSFGQNRWQTHIIDPDMHYYTGQEGRAIQQTIDGGYVFTGYQRCLDSQHKTRTADDLLVCKSDSLGVKIWGCLFGGEGIDHGHSIQQTRDGGFVVAGYTNSFGAGDYDFWVLKLTSAGQLEWSSTLGGKNRDEAREVRQTADGGYIVIGHTESFGAGNSDIWLLKLNGWGRIQWQKTYGGPRADYGHSVYPTVDGGFIVAGETSSFGSGGVDAWIFKLDSKGAIQWEKTYGGAKNDGVFSVRPLRGSGYIAAGQTSSFGAGGFDVLVMKLGTNGNIDASCGSFVRKSKATVLPGKGSAQLETGGSAISSSSGLWGSPGVPQIVTKCGNTVICKK